MPDHLTLTIDDVQLGAAPGTTVLEAALAAGIYIPHLCHHPDLKPVGVCRLCMVEVAGRGPALSCLTPVEQGMVVRIGFGDLRVIGRATQGVRLIQLRENDRVVAVAKVEPEEAGSQQ